MKQNMGNEFYPVDWADGLLVRADHFRHSDRRTDALVAECHRLSSRRWGLSYLDERWQASVPICEIKSIGPIESQVPIVFAINCSIVGLCSSGLPVRIGSQLSDPTLADTIQLSVTPPELRSSGDLYLLCVTNGNETSVVFGFGSQQNREVELAAPKPVGELISEDRFVPAISHRHANLLPIARFVVQQDRLILDTKYTPPVMSLAIANRYLPGSVTDLRGSIDALYNTVLQYILALRQVNTSTQVTGSLLPKYLMLMSLLHLCMVGQGLLSELAQVSPSELNSRLIHPAVQWWKGYSVIAEDRTQIDQQSSVLLDFSQDSVNADVGKFLLSSTQFFKLVRELFTL